MIVVHGLGVHPDWGLINPLRRVRGSAQIRVAGADHFFSGRENELVSQVRLFLDQRLK